MQIFRNCLPFLGNIFEIVRLVLFYCKDPFRATLRNQFQTFWKACLVDTVRNHRLLLFNHLLALLPKTLVGNHFLKGSLSFFSRKCCDSILLLWNRPCTLVCFSALSITFDSRFWFQKNQSWKPGQGFTHVCLSDSSRTAKSSLSFESARSYSLMAP